MYKWMGRKEKKERRRRVVPMAVETEKQRSEIHGFVSCVATHTKSYAMEGQEGSMEESKNREVE